MIGLNVSVTGLDSELFVSLEHIDAEMRPAIEAKMAHLVEILRAKVHENLSGKVLQTKSGALVRALTSGVENTGSLVIGFVAIESENPTLKQYATAHEYGGKSYYDIFPVSKRMLRFLAKSGDVVVARYVRHPPAQERSFLRSALRELRPTLIDEMATVLDDLTHGR